MGLERSAFSHSFMYEQWLEPICVKGSSIKIDRMEEGGGGVGGLGPCVHTAYTGRGGGGGCVRTHFFKMFITSIYIFNEQYIVVEYKTCIKKLFTNSVLYLLYIKPIAPIVYVRAGGGGAGQSVRPAYSGGGGSKTRKFYARSLWMVPNIHWLSFSVQFKPFTSPFYI